MTHWIRANQSWPSFSYDNQRINSFLTQARQRQGHLFGLLEALLPDAHASLIATALEEELITTSAIEGEILKRDSVRASVARRLGIDTAGMTQQVDREVEGLIDILFDATDLQNPTLTKARLCAWQAALFPTGYSGIKQIQVGDFRAHGEMQIVSSPPGRQTVHYEAPPAENLQEEVAAFLSWFNKSRSRDDKNDGLIRAGMAHLWFEVLHPFDDGNGRVGRAIIDMALAQDDQLPQRFYSFSQHIMNDRKNYYRMLEAASSGDGDITEWLMWFLKTYLAMIDHCISQINLAMLKQRFWQQHAESQLNERQCKALNRLLDAGPNGFEDEMTTKKYIRLTRTSRATAYRELSDLVEKQCLKPTDAKGRSAAYELCWPD